MPPLLGCSASNRTLLYADAISAGSDRPALLQRDATRGSPSTNGGTAGRPRTSSSWRAEKANVRAAVPAALLGKGESNLLRRRSPTVVREHESLKPPALMFTSPSLPCETFVRDRSGSAYMRFRRALNHRNGREKRQARESSQSDAGIPSSSWCAAHCHLVRGVTRWDDRRPPAPQSRW